MYIQYANIKYLTFECQTSISQHLRWIVNIQMSHISLPPYKWIFECRPDEPFIFYPKMHRWMFDIQISNIHLSRRQMDVGYSNIKCPCGRSDTCICLHSNVEYGSGRFQNFDILHCNIEYTSGHKRISICKELY